MLLVRGSVDARHVSDSFQCSSCLARLNMAECDRVSAADEDDDDILLPGWKCRAPQIPSGMMGERAEQLT